MVKEEVADLGDPGYLLMQLIKEKYSIINHEIIEKALIEVEEGYESEVDSRSTVDDCTGIDGYFFRYVDG